MQTHIVQDNKIRIDVYLHKNVLPHLSKTKIQNLIESGDITVKNKENLKISYKLKQKEEILINTAKASIQKEEKFTLKKENLNLNIVFEDDELLVVNKKSGMVVHPTEGKDESGTLVNGLLYHVGIENLSMADTIRPGIVHRIDRWTSGLLLVAKNDETHNLLKEQLEKHTMKRKYIGLVINHLHDDQGIIDSPIGHSNTQNSQKIGAYTTSKDAKNAKDAVTHYKLIKNYHLKDKKFSLVEFRLETGRTHQISKNQINFSHYSGVHMASISRPLVGDTLYGPKKASQPLKVDGPVLHAIQLGFVHPKTKKEKLFETEIPDYFQSILDKLSVSEFESE